MTIGRSVKGHPINAVVLTAPGGPVPMDKRVRIVLMCGQHGDEPASILSMLPMVHELSQTINSYHLTLLQRTVIVWIPVVNPDGFIRSTRGNARGVDLNRDWEDFTQPETAAVAKFVSTIHPQVIVDEHEWNVSQPAMTNCVEVASSGPRASVRLSYLLAHNSAANMPKGGLAFQKISSQLDRDTRLAHRHFVEEGISSMLLETSPNSPMGGRLHWYRNFVMTLIGTLAFPPQGAISNDLHRAMHSGGRPQLEIASLYSPAETSSVAFLYWFAATLIAACIVYKCAVAGGSGFAAQRPTAQVGRGRRLTVADTVRLDTPTRVRLRMLKENRFRPTDRGSCTKDAPWQMQG